MTIILFLGKIPLWQAYLGHDAYSFFRKNPLMTIITVMTLISSQALWRNLELFKFLLSYFGQKALVMQSWMQNDPRVGRFAFFCIYLPNQMHFHSIWVLNLHTFDSNCLPTLIKVVVDMEKWTHPIDLDSIFNFDYSVSLGGIHLVRM